MKKYFSSYWIRSAFYTFLQRFSTTLFGLINFVILTRHFTEPSHLGTWALFLTITGIFEAAKSNLLKNAHIKYASSSNDDGEKITIASSSFLINMTITLFVILLILFFSNWLSYWFNTGKELATMLKWFIPGLIFMVFFSHLEAIQQSHLDFKGGFAGHITRQLSFFIIIVAHKLTNTHLSLTALAMYQSLTIGLGALMLLFFSRRYLFYRFHASKLWMKKITGYGGYIFGSGMVASIVTNLDQMMTARILGPGAVSYYNVAARINLLVDIPSYAASEIIFPKASRASVEEGKERVKYLFEKMVAVLIAVTLPLALIIIMFPHLITLLIAGPTYIAAATILQLYMVAGVFRPAQNQAANLLNSIGKTKRVFIMNTAFLLALLLINYICLKEFGFYGAAIGTLITSLLNFIAWYFLMKKEINLDLSSVFNHIVGTYKSIFKFIQSITSKRKQSLNKVL